MVLCDDFYGKVVLEDVDVGNVMRLAAEELEAGNLVTVIDSANLSTGIGHLVVEAAIMAGR